MYRMYAVQNSNCTRACRVYSTIHSRSTSRLRVALFFAKKNGAARARRPASAASDLRIAVPAYPCVCAARPIPARAPHHTVVMNGREETAVAGLRSAADGAYTLRILPFQYFLRKGFTADGSPYDGAYFHQSELVEMLERQVVVHEGMDVVELAECIKMVLDDEHDFGCTFVPTKLEMRDHNIGYATNGPHVVGLYAEAVVREPPRKLAYAPPVHSYTRSQCHRACLLPELTSVIFCPVVSAGMRLETTENQINHGLWLAQGTVAGGRTSSSLFRP
jgi:hypothetical protein